MFMEQEDKELLQKDILHRLDNFTLLVKYGEGNFNLLGIAYGRVILVKPFMSVTAGSPLVEEVKPYLRPMSSMTLDEKKELASIIDIGLMNGIDVSNINYSVEWEFPWDYISFKLDYEDLIKFIDWLDMKNFDHRGLIDKGLALPAEEGMYN